MLQTGINIFANILKALLVVALLALPGFVFAEEEWLIESYDVVIDVEQDGSLLVSEEIKTNFNVQKHGIFRTIPVSYKDEFGNKIKIGLEFGQIFQDGEPAIVSFSPTIGDKYLRIGDPDVEISGEHTYEINYQVKRGVLFFDEFDEIYWNVTGNDWEVPIKASSAVVRLPDGVEILQTSCYTGEAGSTDGDCGIATNDNVAAFAATDFLTVAVGFPKGVIEEPTFTEKLAMSAKDNIINFLPFGIVGLVVIFWLVRGRDEKMETVIAEYEPPKNLPAVSVGIIYKTFLASSDISAMIIQMAVDGYLDIEVEAELKKNGKPKNKKTITLVKKKSSSGLNASHELLYEMLFKGDKSRVTVKELSRSVSSKKYAKLAVGIKNVLSEEEIYTKGSFFSRNVLFALAGIQIYGAAMAGIFFGPISAVLFILSAVVTFVFAFLITKKTSVGSELVRKVRGYRLYLNTAEKYRLEWQGKEGVFEKHLPYAIALGVTKQWASTFAGMEYTQPAWYHSTYRILDYSALTTDLNGILGSLSGTVAPQSSGSGGGGSSGGGMGGGGGGSW